MKQKYIVIIIFLIILYNLFQVCASTTTDAISVSTYVEGDDKLVAESIQKIYEISPNALKIGFKQELNEKNYFIILWNLTEDNVGILTSNKKYGELKINQSKIIDINDDNKYDLVIGLESINNKAAILDIKEYSEIARNNYSDYEELFDVNMNIREEKIQSSRDLVIYVDFVNFGEGPSHVNIIYSILDSDGKEVYKGVDEKVVYTQDSLIKTFDFLDLNIGNYTLITKIYYGKNQTAESVKDFKVIAKDSSESLTILLIIFISIVIIIILFYYAKKFYASRTEQDK